jgi:hypothetical protein
MKHFKKILLAAALAVCGVTSAQATDVGFTYVPMDSGSPGQFTNTWSFSDMPSGAKDDPFAGPHTAGTAFDDFFEFNVPDSENISFNAVSVALGTSPGVSFLGGGYGLYVLADGSSITLQNATNALSMSGGAWTLSSGTYVLEIAGAYATTGGIFAGQIVGTPAVPEPSSWLMLLAGLATVTGVASRRKNKA